MDISEIWDNLGYLAAPLAALLIFLLARRIPRKWLRIFVRTTAIVLLLISGLTLVVALLDFARSVRIAAIVSPDGKHVAVARWTGACLMKTTQLRHMYLFVRVSARLRRKSFRMESLRDRCPTCSMILRCIGWIGIVC